MITPASSALRAAAVHGLSRALYDPGSADADAPWIELLRRRAEPPPSAPPAEDGDEAGEIFGLRREFVIPLSILGGAALVVWLKTRQPKAPQAFFSDIPTPSTTPAPVAATPPTTRETP